MADPLAQFRKSPQVPPGAASTGDGGSKEEYAAFGAKDKVQRLRIRRAMAPTRSPGYAYLLDVVYDGSYGTNFVLVYTFLMVLVRGQNLQQLVFALENGQVDFIQEFDAAQWDKPSDSSAAFIESIEIVVQESAASISGAEKSKEPVRH